ncbi:hypothetical protein [Candidatus Protofrankia californiensis]|uniref:hypothetical protein n=1 Tax=Candidatus Protofrankia californiensis TaxID=1839754 RepID=UPI001040E967|nr:hypothetical protein [Candidatus Protofrankia californiensis]
MWAKDGFRLAVPSDWKSDYGLARGTIERLATAIDSNLYSLWLKLATDAFDLMNFQIIGESLRPGFIPLAAATAAVDGARKLIASAGTSAVHPRRHINRAYDLQARRVSREALLGHTRDGSFVFPLYVQIGPEGGDDGLFDVSEFESFPRRVTRTLAEALAVTRRLVDDLEQNASDGSLEDAVSTGVSSELCSSLGKILKNDGIGKLRISFSWGPVGAIPPPATTNVSFDSSARPALKSLAERLSAPVPDREMDYAGRLITIGHDPEEREHYLVVHVYRHGRPVELKVFVNREVHSRAVRWYENRTTVVIRGTMIDSGMQQVIRTPTSVKAFVEDRLE